MPSTSAGGAGKAFDFGRVLDDAKVLDDATALDKLHPSVERGLPACAGRRRSSWLRRSPRVRPALPPRFR